MNVYQTYKHKKGNRLLEIHYDENAEDPREWDGHSGIMLCCHGRYNLGDQQFDTPQEIDQVLEEEKPYVILPLYLYDHSGITISTSDFADRWDSGQVGYIYTTKKKLKENWKKLPTKKEATELLKNEVKTYDDYLTGNCFGFIEYEVDKCDLDHEHKENVNSCWGFLGDPEKSGIFDEFDMKEWEEI